MVAVDVLGGVTGGSVDAPAGPPNKMTLGSGSGPPPEELGSEELELLESL